MRDDAPIEAMHAIERRLEVQPRAVLALHQLRSACAAPAAPEPP